METLFPDDKREEQYIYKAFELIETEKVEAMLRKNGIHRNAKVIQHDFKNQSAKWWMAAAILLVAVSSYFIYINVKLPDPQRMADNSLSTIVADYNFTVRNTDLPQQLVEVQMAINNQQWESAELQLASILATTPSTDTIARVNIYFYTAIVEMQQAKYNDAILNFTSVANIQYNALLNDAIWLRGLAYIKNNNYEAARLDLEKIAKIKGWQKAKEATKILEAIKGLN
jgi:tetratricopeptide (TPR) repeat protein